MRALFGVDALGRPVWFGVHSAAPTARWMEHAGHVDALFAAFLALASLLPQGLLTVHFQETVSYS